MLWYTIHSVVYMCDLILACIWLLGLCPFVNRVLHSTYHVKRYNKASTNVIYYINDKCLIQSMRKRKTSTKLGSWAPQGRRLGDERLELLVALGELPRIGRNWAAVEYPRGKSREETRVSTQLVLNKYNTNYEALRLADSTALLLSVGKILLKLFTTSWWITINPVT